MASGSRTPPKGLDRGEVVLFQEGRDSPRIEVRLAGDTVWLSLNQMAELFGRHKSVISRHLAAVFRSGELARKSVVAESATTAADGKTYQVEHFNLDAILSVGYRVNSKRGTQFRIWATQTLREHLLKGYTVNERRLREKGIGELEQAVGLLAKTLTQHALVTEEGHAVLAVVRAFTGVERIVLRRLGLLAPSALLRLRVRQPDPHGDDLPGQRRAPDAPRRAPQGLRWPPLGLPRGSAEQVPMQNPWTRLPDAAPYVLPEDAEFIERFNRTARPEHRFHLDDLPEPFLGAADAPVVLLNLNPGHAAHNVENHRRPEFQGANRAQLELRPTEYPFYLLDPAVHFDGG